MNGLVIHLSAIFHYGKYTPFRDFCKKNNGIRFKMIVSLTKKGRDLQKKLADVPFTVGSSVLCESVTPETAPTLFKMLDDIITKLNE